MLPAAFPNLLANGSSGIAVGMATNIPPHNARRAVHGAAAPHQAPQRARSRSWSRSCPGPDFPTGGVLVEPREQILEAYRTGRGGFRLRAKWDKEDTGRGTYQIVVTEIPYQVQKAKLVERIAELMNEKKLPLLGDVRDEIGRGRAPRPRAQEPHRRSGAADGEPVPADRAGGALRPQHERAVGGPDARRAVAARRAASSGWSTARSCWCGAPSSA